MSKCEQDRELFAAGIYTCCKRDSTRSHDHFIITGLICGTMFRRTPVIAKIEDCN
jgi:hypothetical protein